MISSFTIIYLHLTPTQLVNDVFWGFNVPWFNLNLPVYNNFNNILKLFLGVCSTFRTYTNLFFSQLTLFLRFSPFIPFIIFVRSSKILGDCQWKRPKRFNKIMMRLIILLLLKCVRKFLTWMGMDQADLKVGSFAGNWHFEDFTASHYFTSSSFATQVFTH